VNELRIEEAMNMLADKRYIDLDMEDVSDAVGFSNRQSFYAAFLKENGCTPREYRITHSNMYHNGKKIVKPKKKKTKSAKTKND
jgi:AraC-like DNA-binding protein